MVIENAISPAPAPSELTTPPGPAFAGRWTWVILGAITVVGFALIWGLLPHAREGVSLWQFLAKIVVFVLAIVTVGFLPQRLPGGWLLASLPFAIFLGFVIPRMTMLFLTGPQVQPEYYTYLWSLLYPGIMLSICLAFRMGGGSTGRTIKIGLNGLILVFSGFLEFMWFVVNPSWNYYDMGSIPHIEVIIGHFPSYAGLIVFALCHLPLLIAVNLLPIDRWLGERKAPSRSLAGAVTR